MDQLQPVQARAPIVNQPPIPKGAEIVPASVYRSLQAEGFQPDSGYTIILRSPMPKTNQTVPAITDIAYQTEPLRSESGSSIWLKPPNMLVVNPNLIPIAFGSQSEVPRAAFLDPGSSISLRNQLPTPGAMPGVAIVIDFGTQVEPPPIHPGWVFSDLNNIAYLTNPPPGRVSLIARESEPPRPDSGSYNYSYAHYYSAVVLPSIAKLVFTESPRPESGLGYSSKPPTIVTTKPALSNLISSESQRPEVGSILYFHSYQSANKIVPAQNFIIKQLSDPLQIHDGRSFYRSYTVLLPSILPTSIKTQIEFTTYEQGSIQIRRGTAQLPVAHGYLISSTEAPRVDLYYPIFANKPPKPPGNPRPPTIARSEDPRIDLYYTAFIGKPPFYANYAPAKPTIVKTEDQRLDFGSWIKQTSIPTHFPVLLQPYIAKMLENVLSDPGTVLFANGLTHANAIIPKKTFVIQTQDRLPDDGKTIQLWRLANSSQLYGKVLIAAAEAPQVLPLTMPALYATGILATNFRAPFKIPIATTEAPRAEVGRIILDSIGNVVPPVPAKIYIISKTESMPPEIGYVYQSLDFKKVIPVPGRITTPITQIAPQVLGDGSSYSWYPTIPVLRLVIGTYTMARAEEPAPYPGWASATLSLSGFASSYSANLLEVLVAMSYQSGMQAAMSISG